MTHRPATEQRNCAVRDAITDLIVDGHAIHAVQLITVRHGIAYLIELHNDELFDELPERKRTPPGWVAPVATKERRTPCLMHSLLSLKATALDAAMYVLDQHLNNLLGQPDGADKALAGYREITQLNTPH